MEMYVTNPEIKKALQLNLFTTPEEITRITSMGTQAFVSTQFLEKVTKVSGGMATLPLLEFIRSYIGQFTYVGTEPFSLRYFSTIYDGSIDGIEFQLLPVEKKFAIRRLVGICGVSTTQHMEEKVYG